MISSAPRNTVRASAVAMLLVLFAGSCGDDSPDVSLSPAGERGRQVANANGCAACHGSNGQGGVGPTWVGLAGAEVELRDGTLVVADVAYLTRAIVEPSADLRAGFNLQMPSNSLTESQVADVIAYIEDLSREPAGG